MTTLITTLRALTADVENLLSTKLRPLDITVPQAEFLAVLADSPGSCGADVARELHITPQTGTSVLSGLTRRGLIRTEFIPGDGRRLTITVTPSGHETLANAWAATRDFVNALDELLGPETAGRMADATKALADKVAATRPVHASRRKDRAPKMAPPRTAKTAGGPSRVEDLELTVRSYNCLKHAGINTVAQLVKRTERDLMRIRAFGVGSLDDVVGELAAHGLKLAGGAR